MLPINVYGKQRIMILGITQEITQGGGVVDRKETSRNLDHRGYIFEMREMGTVAGDCGIFNKIEVGSIRRNREI